MIQQSLQVVDIRAISHIRIKLVLRNKPIILAMKPNCDKKTIWPRIWGAVESDNVLVNSSGFEDQGFMGLVMESGSLID